MSILKNGELVGHDIVGFKNDKGVLRIICHEKEKK